MLSIWRNPRARRGGIATAPHRSRGEIRDSDDGRARTTVPRGRTCSPARRAYRTRTHARTPTAHPVTFAPIVRSIVRYALAILRRRPKKSKERSARDRKLEAEYIARALSFSYRIQCEDRKYRTHTRTTVVITTCAGSHEIGRPGARASDIAVTPRSYAEKGNNGPRSAFRVCV